MHLARTRCATPDGPDSRILASMDPQSGWTDVRSAERLRLEQAGATAAAAARIARALVPSSMSAALAGGAAFTEAGLAAAAETSGDAQVPASAPLINALDPSGYRDFMAFEGHFSFGYRWQGKPVPDVMYELPVSYFGNPLSFVGPDEVVSWPQYSEHLDYELELGIVIGRAGRDLTPEQALDHVAGLTILNDFSARDIQAREMAAGLGPSKGKHFACGAGPYLVTLDVLPKSGLRMRAHVNGQTWCDSSSADMIWSVGELVAFASQAERLEPGMLLGTGTCNGGSTIEISRRLAPGDVVELEIEGLGRLRNVLGEPAPKGWWPSRRQPSESGPSSDPIAGT
jgi:2-keto-4-pentenoate hydratase/2-oxohepta-3-ene-1,7-dioic acid hydratase in catechol pathway